MRILLISDQFESGGASRVASIMCKGFVEYGHELHIAADIKNWLVRYELPTTAFLHHVSFKSSGNSPIKRSLSLFSTAKHLRLLIKSIKPDVIIAIHANAYVRTLIANRFTHIPLIAADHTSFARKMDFINTLTRHYLYKYADGISILTKRDEKLLGKKYPQKRVIYNPLSYPLLTEPTNRQKTVLCVGRFDIWKIKGFDLIVEIWSLLSPKFTDWKLVFAGTGKEASVNYIKELVNARGLDHCVEFLGQVDDMKSLYSQSGIFALSSRIEGFPMVLLEAMSQGCPCVAFNVGGASEEMIEKDAGYVIEDGDIDGFKNALSDLMDDIEKRKKCSANAVMSVSKFSIESFGNAWEKMISDTVNEKI